MRPSDAAKSRFRMRWPSILEQCELDSAHGCNGVGRRTQRASLVLPRVPPGRDAGARPAASGGDMVTAMRTADPLARVGHRRDRRRPRDPGAHDRGPRRAALGRGGRRPRPRRAHPDLQRLPGDRRDARRRARRAARAPATRDVDVRMVLSPAWTTDWMSDDGKRKLREYGIAPPNGHAPVHGGGRARHAAHGREVPALRLARHPRARPLRLDLVQGALRVPQLPGAVRLLQGAVGWRASRRRRPGCAAARASTSSRSPRCAR